MTERFTIPEKNVDLEELGLINQNLFPVSGELALRYKAVLKDIFGYECDIDSFRVDKRGVSPELSCCLKELYPEDLEYGENYLNMKSANRFMIVVSPDQKNAPLVASQTSYENELFDLIYLQGKHVIEDITQQEVMFGELENRITLYETADDLLNLKSIDVDLDSPDGTRKKIAKLRKMSDELGDGNNALDAGYIAEMQELVSEVGDVRNRTRAEIFPVTQEIRSFYVEFFRGIHCFRDFARYGHVEQGGVQTIFITHHQDIPKLESSIVALDLHSPQVLDTLHLYNLLTFDEDLIHTRIAEIENEVLLDDGVDVIGLSAPLRKKETVKRSKAFPDVWHELRDMRKILDNTGKLFEQIIWEKSYETRLKLSAAHADKPVVNHMLAELDPTDPIRLFQSNRKKLTAEFREMPANRQRYIAHRLLEHTRGRK